MSETDQGVMLDGARAAGADPDKLRHAFGLLETWVDEGVLPGAAALVARGGQIAGEAYLGLADRARGRPATAGTIWSLASITKPVTATAVMLLVEQGALSLDTQVGSLLPEFLGAPASPFDRNLVTLRHLLTHCSGLPGFPPDNLALRRARRPLGDFIRSFARQPLLFAPGAAHYYSNCAIGLAAEIVGRSAAGALGQPVEEPAIRRYHEVVQWRILAPLGLTDTAIPAPADWSERVAWVEGTGQEGEDWEMANSAYYRGLGIPWGGLFSRPRELARLVDLFLPVAGGQPRAGGAGPRLLSPASARVMTSVQVAAPDAPPTLAPDLRDGAPPASVRERVEWGLGWDVKGGKRPHASGELTSPGTFAHTGASGTMVWADPATDTVCVLLTNMAARVGWADSPPRRAIFSNMVAAALE